MVDLTAVDPDGLGVVDEDVEGGQHVRLCCNGVSWCEDAGVAFADGDAWCVECWFGYWVVLLWAVSEIFLAEMVVRGRVRGRGTFGWYSNLTMEPTAAVMELGKYLRSALALDTETTCTVGSARAVDARQRAKVMIDLYMLSSGVVWFPSCQAKECYPVVLGLAYVQYMKCFQQERMTEAQTAESAILRSRKTISMGEWTTELYTTLPYLAT
jgi:hypothetical protein